MVCKYNPILFFALRQVWLSRTSTQSMSGGGEHAWKHVRGLMPLRSTQLAPKAPRVPLRLQTVHRTDLL
jgi:hypothetical protein